MSTVSDSEKIPNNEEIIEELTKDLESQLLDNKESEEKSPSTKTVIEEKNQDIPEDFDKDSDEEKADDLIPDDYIDEEKLKDLEVTLSDEEKEKRQQDALQLKSRGNDEFKSCKYLESIASYTEALNICPLKYTNDRAVFYANRAASKAKLERNATAIDDCSKAIELNSQYVKAYLRRAKLYEDTDKLDESLEDYKKILELDPGNKEALSASHRLPPLIAEKNEKLKAEMLGKLKDLGNMILKPFGLSTDNFQLQQDPNTGGYSMNFQQNAKK